MQSSMWGEFKQALGWEVHHIGVFKKSRLKKDKLVGGASIMKYRFSPAKNFLYIPEGPVIPYDHPEQAEEMFHGLLEQIDRIADLKGKSLTTHVRLDPRLLALPDYFLLLDKSPFNMEPKHTRMVDVRYSDEQILQNMKPKGRYNIRIAERHGVNVDADHSDAARSVFGKLYANTVTRQKIDRKSPAYFRMLVATAVAHGQGELYIAHKDGEALAAALVVFYGSRATYFFGASSNRHRETMAPYLLHFEIMKAARARGCEWYDLWGVAPKDNDASHDWHGITQFKNKFGGGRFDFIGAYDFVYNEKKYAEFLRESGEQAL